MIVLYKSGDGGECCSLFLASVEYPILFERALNRYALISAIQSVRYFP